MLEPTYTAKTFSAALDRIRGGGVKRVLFWHTFSSAPLDPWLSGAPLETDLPSTLRALLTPSAQCDDGRTHAESLSRDARGESSCHPCRFVGKPTPAWAIRETRASSDGPAEYVENPGRDPARGEIPGHPRNRARRHGRRVRGRERPHRQDAWPSRFSPHELTTSTIVVERFLREARAAAAISSPYICDVYDSGKLEDGRPFLVLELLEGESLYERMTRVRHIDVDDDGRDDRRRRGARAHQGPRRRRSCTAISSPKTSSSRRTRRATCSPRSSISGSPSSTRR